jgi:hypothetical protein
MTQFNAPTPRRASGDLDVYAGLLAAAVLVMLAGVFMLASANGKHSADLGQNNGGLFKIVSAR